jgi:transcriptional regulator with XRE-family HTH domain
MPKKKKAAPGKNATPLLVGFGERLKELRLKAGYTSQETFAYDHGFSRIQYNKWERGADIKLSSVERLAKAFGISVAELLDGL